MISNIPLADSPEILHDISFEIKSGETRGCWYVPVIYDLNRIADLAYSVGRTGAGNYFIWLNANTYSQMNHRQVLGHIGIVTSY